MAVWAVGGKEMWRGDKALLVPLVTGYMCSACMSSGLRGNPRAMSEFVGLVLRVGFPRQVMRVDAAFVTLAAIVRGFVFWRWWLPVNSFTG